MDERFLRIVEKVLDAEGGYSNDPDDPGGQTAWGISQKRYPELDIKRLTRDEAAELYRLDFWTKYSYDRIRDDLLAEKAFSLAVNLGPYKAHVLLQISLNYTGKHVVIDGHLGPKSLEAVNSHPNPAWLLAAYKIEAVKYYLSLGKAKFDRGWIKRAVA